MSKNYDKVTVRSYKDDEMAGLESDNRKRGKWFIHGIKDGTADFKGTKEDREEAIEEAKEISHQEDGQTEIVIKNLDSEVEERISTATRTLTPEEEN